MLLQHTVLDVESYFEHVDDTIRIKGHRVGLDLILSAYKDGQTPEQIADNFDTIRLEDVYAAILYYLHNKEQMDQWLAAIEEDYQRRVAESDAHPSPAEQRLRPRWDELRNGETYTTLFPGIKGK